MNILLKFNNIFLAILLGCLFISAVQLQAQGAPSTIDELEKLYNKNIRKSRINGVYIPKNINEAIGEIIDLSPVESLKKFKGAEENFVVKRLHFGLGKWISNKWNFLEGSRYAHYLRMMGVSDPDDMIDITLRSLHRYLNDVPVDIEKNAAAIKERRRIEWQEKMKGRKVISTTTVKIDSTKN